MNPRSPLVLLASALVLVGGACGRSSYTAEVPSTPDAGTEVRGPAVQTGLELAPRLVSLARGTTRQLVATALWSDGTRTDVTSGATWTSSAPLVAAVEAGRVRGLAPGEAEITAKQGDFTAAAKVSVSAATVSKVVVEPATLTLAVGASQQLEALGLLSDGTKQDLTQDVAWTSEDLAIVGIASGPQGGLATALAAGATRITAVFGTASAAVDVTVTASPLVRIDLEPKSPVLAVGQRVAFSATGVYGDGSRTELTSQATWESSAPDTLAIDATGTATALAAGSATVSATFSGVSATTAVSVSAAALTKLAVTPATLTLAVGETQHLTATGTFADGREADLSDSVVWTVNNPALAAMSNAIGHEGEVTGLASGRTEVVATFGAVTATAAIHVSNATLVSIAIDPATLTLAKGLTGTLRAIATDGDGETREVTDKVSWAVADGAIASISNGSATAGQLAALAVGATKVTATLGTLVGEGRVTVTAASVQSLALSPTSATLVAGGVQAFEAQAQLSDGTSADVTEQAQWTTDDERVAVVSTLAGSRGRVTTVRTGQTQVHAALGGKTASAGITVTAPVLREVQVTPFVATIAAGEQQPYVATAVWSDGTTWNVTQDAQWSISSTTLATLNQGGGGGGGPGGGPGGRGVSVTGRAVGTVTITAAYQGLQGTAQLTISDARLIGISVSPVSLDLRVGASQPLQVVGLYSDGTTQNLNNASFSSSNRSVADVSNAGGGGGPGGGPGGGRGIVTGIAAGSATITVTSSGYTITVPVAVTAVQPIELQISPVTASLAKGDTLAYQATAVFDDATTQNVTQQTAWTSSGATVAAVTNTGGGGPGGGGPGGGRGQATGLAAGTTTITAMWNGLTATATLTVTDAVLRSIEVTPATLAMPAGLSQPYQAVGIYSDGTSRGITQQATWLTSAPAIAAVSNGNGSRGLVTTLAPGQVSVTATLAGITGTAALTVTDATVLEVQVTPALPTLALGLLQQFTATALFSDFSLRNVTNDATWAVADAAVAQVSNANGSKGRVTALAQGTTAVTATWRGCTGRTTLAVTGAVLREIQVTPAAVSLPAGLTVRFTATAVMSDDTTRDVTGAATWTSSAEAVVSVSNANPRGLATTLSPGAATITATWNGGSGSTTITVGTQQLQSISLAPASGTVRVGGTLAFTATGTWDDGSTRDVTALSTWISRAAAIATVSNADDSRGLATVLAAGSASIEAHFLGRTGTATLTVSP